MEPGSSRVTGEAHFIQVMPLPLEDSPGRARFPFKRAWLISGFGASIHAPISCSPTPCGRCYISSHPQLTRWLSHVASPRQKYSASPLFALLHRQRAEAPTTFSTHLERPLTSWPYPRTVEVDIPKILLTQVNPFPLVDDYVVRN